MINLSPIRIIGIAQLSTTSDITTAEQLAALPSGNHRYELIKGVLRMMSPAGNVHGRVTSNIHWRLARHVHENKLGTVYAAETGFCIDQDPDTVRAPDIAFVSASRLLGIEETSGYLRLAPDFVAETVSPNDTFSEIEDKSLCWLSAGVRMVLVADPGTKTFQVYRSAKKTTVLSMDDVLDADDVVSRWKLHVKDAFA
jgi:Uma2 family endonuclease